MILIWSRKAERQLLTLKEYISRDKPGAAKKTAQKIINIAENLLDQPGLGYPGRYPNTREIIVPFSRESYTLVYRVKNNSIEIAAIFSGSQKWPEEI